MYQDDWRRRMRIITIGFICFLVVGGIAIGIVSAVIKNNDSPGTSPNQPTEIVEPSGEDVWHRVGGVPPPGECHSVLYPGQTESL